MAKNAWWLTKYLYEFKINQFDFYAAVYDMVAVTADKRLVQFEQFNLLNFSSFLFLLLSANKMTWRENFPCELTIWNDWCQKESSKWWWWWYRINIIDEFWSEIDK